jgi:hypothetical protein
MGKLADAIKAYKTSPDNSPAEREAAEIMRQITESEWWDQNVGKKFKWPKKQNRIYGFGFGEEFVHVGNFIIHKDKLDETLALLTKDKA